MLTLEITIQRNKDKAWPVILTRTRDRDFLPVRTDAELSLDVNAFLDDTFSPEYGETLGRALFQGSINDAFVGALTSARASSQALRLLLFIEAEDLRELRWERLKAPIDGDWVSLAGNQQVLFSQYLPSTTDRRFPPIGRKDLRALVLVAAPSDMAGNYKLADFDVAATVSSVRQALGEIPVTVLANTEGPENAPTLDNLSRRITDEPFSILHIVCHGSYRSQDGETILFFPNETGRPVPATSLIERLQKLSGARGLPHLAFLSTCESADPRAENGLGGLGHRLVRDLGMPVVVAMTDKVSIVTAEALASAFYAHLRNHGEADRALAEASSGLLGRFDLSVPALFTRIGGKPIFSDSLDRRLNANDIRFGLTTLASLLEVRAPVLMGEFDGLARKIQNTLDVDFEALSPQLQQEQEQSLAQVNQLCLDITDISFNALALGQQPPSYDARPPFRGLFPFRNDDKEFFFGREILVAKLVNRVREHNFLAVLGPSGSGKSSLVLAGLVPAMGQSSCYMTPNSDPMAQLEAAMRGARSNSALVVDQFEELFTLCSDKFQREAFIKTLLDMVKVRLVIVTMRADFWGEVAPYPDLREMMQSHSELVAPMNAVELRRAMDMQAAHVGLRFEADLSQDILDDVENEPGAMPLLQHALLLLWNRRHGRWLRQDEYHQMGGIREAIARTADEVYLNLDERQREQMRNIFVRLTRIDSSGDAGDGVRDTRRRVGLAELVPAGSDPSETANLVKRLADARIIVTSVNAAMRQEEVEVAHEALIRYWPRLRTWLDEDRVSLRLRDGIREAALEWDAGKRDVALLIHRGGRLEDAELLSRQPRFALNVLELDYLKACIKHREHEKLVVERRRRRIVIASLLAALLMLFLGCYGLIQAGLAKNNEALALRNANTATYALGLAQIEASTAEAARSTSDVNAQLAQDQAATATYALGMAQAQAATALAAQNEALRQAGIATQALGVSDQQRATAQSAQGTSQVNAVAAQQQAGTATVAQGQAIFQAGTATVAQGQAVYQAATAQAAQKTAVAGTTAEAAQAATAVAAQATANAGATLSANNAATAVAAQATSVANANQAQARALAAMALNELNNAANPGLAYLLAAEAYRRDSSMTAAYSTLLSVVGSANDKAMGGFLHRPDGVVIGASLPPYHVQGRLSLESLLPKSLPVYANSDIYNIVINATGTTLAVRRRDGSIIIWDLASRSPIKEFAGDVEYFPTSLAISPDGKSIAIGESGLGGGCISLTSTSPNQNVGFSLCDAVDGDGASSLAFSPDGQILAVGSRVYGDIHLWNVSTQTKIGDMTGHTGSVLSLAFSHDGKTLASAGNDKTIRLWNVTNMTMVGAPLIGHADIVNTVVFSPDGKTLASASDDETIRLWNIDTQFQMGGPIANATSSTGGLFFWGPMIAFSSDGKTLASTYAQKVYLWNVTTRAPISIFTPVSSRFIRGLIFSPDGKTVISADDLGIINLWDISAQTQIEKVINPASAVRSLAFSPDGSILASGGSDHNVRLWNVAKLSQIGASLSGHTQEITSLDFSPDGKVLASGSNDETIRLWDVASQSSTGALATGYQVQDIAFGVDGSSVLSVGSDNSFKKWNVITRTQTGPPIFEWAFSLPAWAFSPDGTTIAISTYFMFPPPQNYLWNVQERASSGSLPGIAVTSFAFSSNGKMLAMGTGNSVLLWDIDWQKQIGASITGDQLSAQKMTFSPDGKILAVASGDKAIHLVDIASQTQIGLLTGHKDNVASLAYNSMGLLASGTYDMTNGSDIRIWNFAPSNLFSLACQIASRNFTQAEWALYFPGETYKSTCAQWPAGK